MVCGNYRFLLSVFQVVDQYDCRYIAFYIVTRFVV